MEHGKIRLINSGGQSDAGFTQTIAVAVGNRVYRITNDGPGSGAPGSMRIRISRQFFWFTINSVFDLDAGRSVDVYGSTITVVALETLQLFGSYDTI
jgi:hypothetical protein